MAVELIIDDDTDISTVDVDAGGVRRSVRAPKKPSHSYKDVLEKEDIRSEVLKIERASKRVEAGQAEALNVDVARKPSKKRSRGTEDDGVGFPSQSIVTLTMPEDIAVIVNTYKPCIVCHELLGVDGLSYCLDCTKYFHGLCLKGSTIPLNCSSCERTRDASNTASKYKNERVLGEYIRVGPLKNLFQYRMTLLHRYTHPHLYKGLKHTAKPSTPLATPVKASPKSKSAAGKKNHKKKAPFRGVKDSTTTQIGANEADDADAFFELTSDPVALPNKAVDSPRKKPRPDDRVTAIAVGLEDDEARDNGNDALDGSDSNALPNETDITAPPQPSAVQETVENLIEMVLVKVDRHPDGSILEEASTADFSDLREFHGIPLVTSPLVPLRPVPTPTPRGAHDLEDVPMLFENIVDDEHHEPAEVTESYESAWPAGMMPDSTAVTENPIAASEDRKNA